MRVMVIIKENKESEAGILPDARFAAAMDKFNQELAKAGVLLAAEGLYPSSQGKRLRFSGGKTTVIDGPFAETKELIAGFWLWQVKSMDEAIEWIKRVPVPEGSPNAGDGEIEIRQVFEQDDFNAQLADRAAKA